MNTSGRPGDKLHSMHYISFIGAFLFYASVALLGRYFTAQGVETWYPGLAKPSYTPPGSFIGIVWTVIYILSALSLTLFIRAAGRERTFWMVISLYFVNGLVNAAWSYIFFVKHFLGLAVATAALIGVTTGLMIYYARRYSLLSGLLLLPYLLWVAFATFLSFDIYRLN